MDEFVAIKTFSGAEIFRNKERDGYDLYQFYARFADPTEATLVALHLNKTAEENRAKDEAYWQEYAESIDVPLFAPPLSRLANVRRRFRRMT